MPIGYSGAPRVTGNNMESRIRRLSRSLLTGNNGTPLRVTLLGGANTQLIEEFNFEAAPGGANTSARRPVWSVYSTQYRNADNTSVVNAGVIAGSWNTCGFLEVRCHTDNTLIWGINNTFGGGPCGVLYMSSAGYMVAKPGLLCFDETIPQLRIASNTNTDPNVLFLNGISTGYTVGMLSSDSNTFMIAPALGGNTLGLRMNQAGFTMIGDQIATGGANTVLHERANTANTTPVFLIEQVGTGDSSIEFSLTGAQSWSIGVDNSDDRFHINPASALSTSGSGLIMDTSGQIQFGNALDGTIVRRLHMRWTGDGYIRSETTGAGTNGGLELTNPSQSWGMYLFGTSSDVFAIRDGTVAANAITIQPSSRWIATGGIGTALSPLHHRAAYNNTTPMVLIDQDGTGDASIGFDVTGSISFVLGIDNSDASDSFRISPGTALSPTGLSMNSQGGIKLYTNSTITDPMIEIEQDGIGDAVMRWTLTGGETFVIGYDNSDSDHFKLSRGSSLGTGGNICIDTGSRIGYGGLPLGVQHRFHMVEGSEAGGAIFANSGSFGFRFTIGNVADTLGHGARYRHGFRTASGESFAWVTGTSAPTVFDNTGRWCFGQAISTASARVHIYENSAASNTMVIEQDGTGDAQINFLLSGTTGFAVGIDNSDSDIFKIHPGNTVAASTFGLHMTTAGRVGIGDQTSGGNWLYVVPDSETSANATRTTVKAELPKRAVDANETNYYFGFHSEWQSGTFDIGSGITDSGSREGFRCEAFVNDSTFQGTLAAQRGLYVRAGHASGASNASAVITNSIGILVENLRSGSVTATNEWGIYQCTAEVQNFFAGRSTFHRDTAGGNPVVIIEQDGAGDAAIGFLLTGGQTYTVGIDNSESDTWRVAPGNTITSNTGIGVTTTGEFIHLKAVRRPITEVNVNTTLNTTHHTVLVNTNSANRVITLPSAAVANSRVYTVKKIDSASNTVTIDGSGAQTIDGSTTLVLSSQYDGVTIQSDGTEWWVLSRT